MVARGGSPDVVLCPDVAPCMDSRFDCGDLLQRSVIHYEGELKASSAIICTHSGRKRPELLRVYLAALPKIEAPALSPLRPGLLYWPPQLAASSVPSTDPPEEKNERGRDPAE